MRQKVFYIHPYFNWLVYQNLSTFFNPIIKKFSQHSHSLFSISQNSNTAPNTENL
ncbi:hypothetical protein LIG30_4278 [Burkholderia sp. lig30]|nr:hypothetical protein LIG30_4278 [Burkholderia sp. lig30]